MVPAELSLRALLRKPARDLLDVALDISDVHVDLRSFVPR